MNMELIQKIDRLHPYPAKFTVDLALEYITKYTNEGDTVYDPFVGSGTTLLASSLLQRKGYGTDVNHIAILISKGKLLHLSDEEMAELREFIDYFDNNYSQGILNIKPYHYASIEHWFCQNAILVLSFILERINCLSTEPERIFAQLVMSSIVNTVSNQDGDTRYAAIEKPNLTIERIAAIFSNKFKAMLSLMAELNLQDRTPEQCVPFLLDSKKCCEILEKESVNLILTSPPYINTYDYYLYHKHRMNWLGYDVKYSMEAEIGSRREFSSLKHNETKFSDDLKTIFASCNDVLKPKGKIVIVIGDGKVSGNMYNARENMIEICSELEWKLIDYSFSLLDKTSKSFVKSYRTTGKKEHIMVFQKG